MNKKGEFLEQYLIPLIFTLVLSGVVVTLGVTMVAKLMTSSEDKSTIRNYENLVSEVEEVLRGNDFSFSDNTLTIADGWTLIGFDYDANVYANGQNDPILRPEKCEDKACICLYDSEIERTRNPVDIEEPEECEPFNGNIKFVGSLQQEPAVTTSVEGLRGKDRTSNINEGVTAEASILPEFLIVYGSRFNSIKEFYIEKLIVGDITYVIITPRSDATKLREKFLTPCSDLSDAQCIGRFADDFIIESFEVCKIDKETFRCRAENLARCAEGLIEGKACACGDKEYTDGYCMDAFGTPYHSPIDCTDFNSCDDYCEFSCSPEQILACNNDYCNVGGCKFSGSTGGLAPVLCQRSQ